MKGKMKIGMEMKNSTRQHSREHHKGYGVTSGKELELLGIIRA